MLVLLAIGLAAAPPAKAVLVDRIAATVEGRVITASQVDARAARFRETREQALNALIERALVQRAAGGLALTATEKEIDRAIDDVIAKNQLSKEQFLDALKEQGWDLAAYRAEIGLQLVEMKWLLSNRERDRQQLIDALKRDAVIEVRR